MVSGHLQEKKGFYYIVLNYRDENGTRKTKWQATGLAVKGNKKRAELLLQEARKSFELPKSLEDNADDGLFSTFMVRWLEVHKTSISPVTYAAYANMVERTITPYFKAKGILLEELTAKHIQDFYSERIKHVTASTVIHYHGIIHKALKYAVKMDMLAVNPADKVERPKRDKFIGGFYDCDEMKVLFEAVKGHKLELAVLFGGFYGLRRSEIVGLKWDAIDFKNNTITIRHTVNDCLINGERVRIESDKTKTKSSLRVLPLVSSFRERLLELKAAGEECRRVCKSAYNKQYLDYIYVDELGERIKPSYITCAFPELLAKKGLRRIRFHDLRHSCASMLLANGVPMKQIQEWLGHSDFSTTANIYAHLDYNSKLSSASALMEGLRI